METINIKLEDIIPYKNNAKKHNRTQINNVAESIKQFGMVQPLVLDKNNEIVIGHCRYEALKKLGEKEAPCVMVEDLTEEQIKKLRNLDNKLNESEWDYDLLKFDIEDLDFSGFEVDWEIPDLDFEEKETEEDDFDIELPVEPKSKLGDIYQLGNHRLMCGDSTSIDDVEKLMDGNKADMVFTDPPYGVNYEGINNDNRDGLGDLLDKAFNNMMINSNEGSSVYCFHSDRCADIFNDVFRKYCHFSSMIIWKKQSLVLSQTDYQSIHEPCMYGWFNNGNHNFYGDRKQISVWEYERETIEGHTTPKPVKLICDALNNSSKKENKVLDLFGGSGSTLIVCEQLNRNCYMMELDPKYVDVIIERWEQYTGKKAVLLNE